MASYSLLIPASAISLPHFALSLWMNFAKASGDEGAGSAPRTRIFSIAAGSLNAFTKAAFNVLMISGGVPAPVVEAGLGIWPGLSGGLLAVDALGSATLLPTGLDKLSVDSNAARVGQVALGFGYGVRVGVLEGSFPIPSISVSVMRRTLPRLQYGSLAGGDQFEFDTDLKATNVRVAASMRLLFIDAAAGFGFDKYSSTAHLRFYDNPPLNTNVRTVPLSRANSRQVLFVNAGLDMMAAKLVGEFGYQTGKDQTLSRNYTAFDPKAGHVYGGVGFRISF